MAKPLSPEDLGEPALKLAGFQLWIHGREFPEARDFDDGNWLRVTAHCGASGASVWAQGSIITAADVEWFRRSCLALQLAEATAAALDPFEPELRIIIEAADRMGHLSVRVQITPDHLSQSHAFEFEIDQSYLPQIIDQCTRILKEYPIRR